MKRSLEQRYAIKFCVRLGKNATETFQMLQKAFKDDCISRSQSGKTDENVDRVLEVLRTDRRLSIQQIADTLHMSTFVVHGIVTEDLQMRKVCAKLVTKVLTQDQKELRVLRCPELLDLIQNEPGFLNSVVTGDESWMFEYDPESKRQSCAWHTKSSPRPKKARKSKSRIKTMIIVFFDIRRIVLRRLKRRIARVKTDIKDTVKLHHDNATSHTAFIITNLLVRSNTPVIPHPPYSLDLASCDFFLFTRLKREMKGKHWETVKNIQHHVTTFLRRIPVEEFQGAFQAWETRLRKFGLKYPFLDFSGSHWDQKILSRYKIVGGRSRIFSLNPFQDEQGVLRVGGRLRWALGIPYHQKQEYWILRAKDQIKKYVRDCVICCRYNRTTQHRHEQFTKGKVDPGKTIHVQWGGLCGTHSIEIICSQEIAVGFYLSRQQLKELTAILANDGTEWQFNPPCAPHFSRPLAPLDNDSNDLEALNPAHFLLTSTSQCVPYEELILVVYRFYPQPTTAEQMENQRTQYVSRIIGSYKGRTCAPAKWLMGRVVEVYPGKDGVVRVVSLRTMAGVIKRPLVKLALLQGPPVSFDGAHQLGEDVQIDI
ncbi:hypothetical protein LAZ67_X002487 [Cordylochernes scorpioides]|uniref:DUF5641 domain-containing protein n=1 Tax=Cordylochernes scorpioides TaxID=51811 RepID=A0ABY6LTX8_9ARAC|nr:hypothetical protein LAZ67_X002487 [Cordylochernes scorpioides]